MDTTKTRMTRMTRMTRDHFAAIFRVQNGNYTDQDLEDVSHLEADTYRRAPTFALFLDRNADFVQLFEE